VLAEGELALAEGRAAVALEKLASVARAGVLSPGERLLHARALLGAGRAKEAEAEARELGSNAGVAADATELLGDARLALGDSAGARASYEQALVLGTKRTRDVRAKHAGVVALDPEKGAASVAELEALYPRFDRIPADRAANAALAPIAPWLYRRALDASDPRAADRDLEAAWRLSAPPAELRTRVAQLFAGLPLRLVPVQLLPGSAWTDERTDWACHNTRLWRRAAETDPGVDLSSMFEGCFFIRVWVEEQGDRQPEMLVTLADRLFAEWSQNSISCFVQARAHWRQDPARALELLSEAVARLPDVKTAPETGGVTEVAYAIARTALKVHALSGAKAALALVDRVCAYIIEQDRAEIENARKIAADYRPDPQRLEAELMTARPSAGIERLIYDLAYSDLLALVWERGGKGDSLTLAFDAPAAGPATLGFCFVTTLEGATFDVSVGGNVVFRGLDLYSPGTAVNGERLATVELAKGRNEIRVELTKPSSRSTMNAFGLDYVRIVEWK
jgi:hypothetical protein